MHLVLVFEPLREPLWLLRRRVAHEDCTTHESLPFIKTHIRILLEGLDYMHSQGRVIHTDLKLDNIMVAFEHQSTMESFLQRQTSHPMGRKRNLGGRTVYRCHNDFGPIFRDLGKMIPQITDFGLAQQPGGRAEPLIHPIQPNEFRAPEVLLGIGWSYSADMWNFGAMPRTQPYSPAQHLADMIAIVGAIPPSLIERERQMRHWRWSPPAVNPDGKLCDNVAEFYGGPFLAEDENELPRCVREEGCADLFVEFMKRMLCWVPEERATAAELLNDAWLDSNSR
ncbi:hypothetical protein QQS21_007431 [Conoideocrella luteorostrata]|uniref:Protein kinase domain-containing protein n=1 Tax=Conoideocrella luteorostrata TaxID=1105319 RepID=A0AAJ0CNG4_9HYPO|nr:hypothetical protein QQS21_007431 [Conoideocrella luteorostrata]